MEDGYGRRIKDWADRGFFYQWIETQSFGKALKHLHSTDPDAVLRLLVQRLDDERQITGGVNREATVSSLCGGSLCAIGGANLGRYVPDILSAENYVATKVLEVALRREPKAVGSGVLQCARDTAARGTASNWKKTQLTQLLEQASQLIRTEDFRAAAAAALRNYTNRSEPAVVRSLALAVLRKINPADERLLDEFLALLSEDTGDEDFANGVSRLEVLPDDRKGEVVHLLLARLDARAGHWDVFRYGVAWQIFRFLERKSIREPFAEEIVRTLRRHVTKVPEDDRLLQDGLSRLLTRLGPNTLFGPIYSISSKRYSPVQPMELKPTSVEAAYCTLPLLGEAAERTRRMLAGRRLCENAIYWAVNHSALNGDDHPPDDCVATLAPLRGSDPLRWDREVRAFLSSDDWREPISVFAEAVLRYWKALPASELSEASADILARVDQGVDVRDLWREP
jgi:hypothetical protein